jgi:site-specific DNA recombinase
MVTRCGEYLRVSSKKQKEGASLDEQHIAIVAYADGRGWEIVASYEEAASTWHGTRDEFERMLEDARSGKFDVILVWSLDRFARRSGQIHSVIDELKAIGVQLILVKEGVNLCDDSVASLAIKSALALAAELENVSRSDRMRMAWGHRRELLLFHASLPTGYRHVGKYQPAAIDEEKAAGVRRAFQLYATGQYPFIDLCSKLNDEGYRVKSGKRYSYRTLHSILTNRSYTGFLYVNDRWVKSNELALIDEDLFNRVQEVMGERGKAPRSVSRKFSTYLLNGLLYCVHCERKLYAQRTWPDGVARYKDSSYFRRLVCPANELIERGEGVMVKEIDLVPQVEAIIESFQFLPSWRERVLDILASQDERRAIKARRQAIELKLERLKDLYIEGDKDLGEYRIERDALRDELTSLVVPGEARVLDAGQFLEDMIGIWDQADLQERHDLLTSIFRKLWVNRVERRIVACEVYPDFIPVFRQMSNLTENEGRFVFRQAVSDEPLSTRRKSPKRPPSGVPG